MPRQGFHAGWWDLRLGHQAGQIRFFCWFSCSLRAGLKWGFSGGFSTLVDGPRGVICECLPVGAPCCVPLGG